MRNLTFLFFFSALLLAMQAPAQELTKQQLKEWKKTAKEYQRNPQALISLTSERDRLRTENADLQTRINSVQSQQLEWENRITQLENENKLLLSDLQNAQESIRQLTQDKAMLAEKTATAAKQPAAPTGLVYRIQIGAFKKNRVEESLATSDEMKLEDADGMQKVMVGLFTNYEDAKQLMNSLKKMGVKGAWIVPYRDGQRISLKEALGKDPQ